MGREFFEFLSRLRWSRKNADRGRKWRSEHGLCSSLCSLYLQGAWCEGGDWIWGQTSAVIGSWCRWRGNSPRKHEGTRTRKRRECNKRLFEITAGSTFGLVRVFAPSSFRGHPMTMPESRSGRFFGRGSRKGVSQNGDRHLAIGCSLPVHVQPARSESPFWDRRKGSGLADGRRGEELSRGASCQRATRPVAPLMDESLACGSM
jgi:hypothetical protein